VKIVLDTNVLLAALATRGFCASLFEICLAGHDVYLSESILNELSEHLRGKFKMTLERTTEVREFLAGHCLFVAPLPVPNEACRDPDDLIILGTALAGAADCIVTGDQDLLILGQFQGIEIYTPRALYELLK